MGNARSNIWLHLNLTLAQVCHFILDLSALLSAGKVRDDMETRA
jgi:hypothetical protein